MLPTIAVDVFLMRFEAREALSSMKSGEPSRGFDVSLLLTPHQSCVDRYTDDCRGVPDTDAAPPSWTLRARYGFICGDEG